jgi:hypothetical protein
MTITTSNAQVNKQYSLEWRDVFKSFLIAVLTPIIPIVEQSIEAGTLTFNWKLIGLTAVGAALAYLTKNFLTPTQTVVQGDATKPNNPPTNSSI